MIRSFIGPVTRVLALVLTCALASAALSGCNADSFFNPSVTGYWEHTPTTIPILERIDVIEHEEDYWGQTTDVSPEDLMPSDLTYRTVPGDIITVSIADLFGPGEGIVATRRIEADGLLRLPELGNIPAAGRTAQQIQDEIEVIVERDIIQNPEIDVVIEQSRGFNYTVYGVVPGPGLYSLQAPDFRLIDALATAGGVSSQIQNIYIIRRVRLSEDVAPYYERTDAPVVPSGPTQDSSSPPVDIEDLIKELEEPSPGSRLEASPGMFRQDDPFVDVDDLEPPRVSDEPTVDIDELRRQQGGDSIWVYVEERGEWIRMSDEAVPTDAITSTRPDPRLFVERIIKIPYERLLKGDSKYNIVVRPRDLIYIEAPPTGVIYIDGQINRPGVFGLPATGITLSRLVAAAGGLGQLAIPERVDLVRMVGTNREAVIRLNLGAIRTRTEPDVWLKADDHIIIGTSWVATPLAIIRSGFRTTYGFGFLLDRNFGNDVFGAPPSNVGR